MDFCEFSVSFHSFHSERIWLARRGVLSFIRPSSHCLIGELPALIPHRMLIQRVVDHKTLAFGCGGDKCPFVPPRLGDLREVEGDCASKGRQCCCLTSAVNGIGISGLWRIQITKCSSLKHVVSHSHLSPFISLQKTHV